MKTEKRFFSCVQNKINNHTEVSEEEVQKLLDIIRGFMPEAFNHQLGEIEGGIQRERLY